jgi:hypothetical protein
VLLTRAEHLIRLYPVWSAFFRIGFAGALPDIKIVVSQTVIPNEFGQLDKALTISSVYPDSNLPF